MSRGGREYDQKANVAGWVHSCFEDIEDKDPESRVYLFFPTKSGTARGIKKTLAHIRVKVTWPKHCNSSLRTGTDLTNTYLQRLYFLNTVRTWSLYIYTNNTFPCASRRFASSSTRLKQNITRTEVERGGGSTE